MIPKIITLDLSQDKYKIIEPSIYDMFVIEELLEDKENIEENIKEIYKILGIDIKYLYLSNIIIEKVLNGFSKKNKQKGGNDYFLGILGMLAHHNFMNLKDFIKKYTLSDLSELLKVREYYYNIINDKASENTKFHDKTALSDEKEKEIEDFIKKMTRK